MNHIDGFFSKLKSAFAAQANRKEIVALACLHHAGVSLTDEQIEIQGPIVRLNIGSAARSTIFMKKAVILAEINEKMKPAIADLR